MRLIAFPQWNKLTSLLRGMARQSAANYAQRNIVRIIPKNGIAHLANYAANLQRERLAGDLAVALASALDVVADGFLNAFVDGLLAFAGAGASARRLSLACRQGTPPT